MTDQVLFPFLPTDCKPDPSTALQPPTVTVDSPSPAAPEVMDVEGVHLEEGSAAEVSQGEDSELSLSFQGYVAELRQCQSKMRGAQLPQNGRNPSEAPDCKTELYKATIV